MERYPELYEDLAFVVKKHVKYLKKPVIIDLGCGPGLLLKAIDKIIPKSSLTGIDPSRYMLEIAKEKTNKSQLIVGKSDNIPLENNFADVIVSRFSLSYWKNPNDSFKEISRVLKPDGLIVLEALNRDFSKWNLFLLRIRMMLRGLDDEMIHYSLDVYKDAYSFEQVFKMLIDADFKILESVFKPGSWKFLMVGKKK